MGDKNEREWEYSRRLFELNAIWTLREDKKLVH